MNETLESLHGHYIVCGFARFGRRLCDELGERGMKFTVIEREPDVLAFCRERKLPCLLGDATEDATLVRAGIERAAGLAAALSMDADNAAKFKQAGANRVISLCETGAAKMAQMLATPHVQDFIDVVTSQGRELDFAEALVRNDAPYAGRPLAESGFADRGIIIVGIRRADGELLLPPVDRESVQPVTA